MENERAQYKVCRFCKNVIKQEAKRCFHCMEVLEPIHLNFSNSKNQDKDCLFPKDWQKFERDFQTKPKPQDFETIGDFKIVIDLFALVILFLNGPTKCMVREVRQTAENERPLDKTFLECVGDYLKKALKSDVKIEFVCDCLRQKFPLEKRQEVLEGCKRIVFCKAEIIKEDFTFLHRIADFLNCPRLKLPKILNPVERNELEEALKIFGFSVLPNAQTLKYTFREKAKSSHPDRVEGMDLEIRILAEKKFKIYLNAYNILEKFVNGDYLLK